MCSTIPGSEALLCTGPEVVGIRIPRYKKKEGRRVGGEREKNPGDAVVAWENKRPSRQLEREAAIGRQVRRRLAPQRSVSHRGGCGRHRRHVFE